MSHPVCLHSMSLLFIQSVVVALCLPRVLSCSILPPKTTQKDSLLNTWRNHFSVVVGWCSSSFCFNLPCPEPLDWICVQSNRFLPCDAMHSAAIAIIRCLSIRPSDTFASCAKMNKGIFKIFSPFGSHTILVFPYQTGWRCSDGNPPNRGCRMQGGMKKCQFSTNISLYRRNSYS